MIPVDEVRKKWGVMLAALRQGFVDAAKEIVPEVARMRKHERVEEALLGLVDRAFRDCVGETERG